MPARLSPLEGGTAREVSLPSLDPCAPICTLKANEMYRVVVSVSPGEARRLGVDVFVDGISAWGPRLLSPSRPIFFEGFHDHVSGALKPFSLKEIEVEEGTSIRAAAAAADAMERAGKIVCKVYDLVPCEMRDFTLQAVADKKELKTTAKKALINGLGTEAPSTTAGTYTVTSDAQLGPLLGEATVLYRDRCAVLIWQTIEEERREYAATAHPTHPPFLTQHIPQRAPPPPQAAVAAAAAAARRRETSASARARARPRRLERAGGFVGRLILARFDFLPRCVRSTRIRPPLRAFPPAPAGRGIFFHGRLVMAISDTLWPIRAAPSPSASILV